jgi:RNA recognition motif-containing protein
MPKLYVGNLASSVTSRALAAHFARAGEVVGALAICDKVSGLCRGFGFVEMAEFADVAVAFSLLNKSELDGRRIEIEPHPALRNGKARKGATAGSPA